MIFSRRDFEKFQILFIKPLSSVHTLHTFSLYTWYCKQEDGNDSSSDALLLVLA